MPNILTGAIGRPRTRAGRRDGGVTSLEFAIVAPVVLLAIFAGLQYVAYYHARDLAYSSAQAGLESARTMDGTVGAGVATAHGFLDRSGAGYLPDPAVTGTRGGIQASISVTGDTPRVVPLIPLPVIRATATGPIERVTTP